MYINEYSLNLILKIQTVSVVINVQNSMVYHYLWIGVMSVLVRDDKSVFSTGPSVSMWSLHLLTSVNVV